MESLVGNHAFVDDDKRTAITAVGLFLRINGLHLTATNQEMEEFTLQCALRLVPLDQMTLWLKGHTAVT